MEESHYCRSLPPGVHAMGALAISRGGIWSRHTFREVGCPAPLWRSAFPKGAIVDAEAKLLKGGLLSLMGDTVRGACSPMLPSLPSSGIAESKADTCMNVSDCGAAASAHSCWDAI